MRTRTLILAGLLQALSLHSLAAQTWPDRPIKMILPASAGGNSGILGRILAEKVKVIIGQPVIFDHRAGAAGRIAAEAASKAAPDGYTFFMTSSAPHGVVPAMTKKLSYDPVKSFAPVAMLATTPNVLYVRSQSRFKNMQDLVEAAKREPGKLNFGAAGFGTTMHLSAILLALKAKIEITHVPYKGGSEVLVGVLSENVDAAFESLPVAKPQIEGGNIRALAITSRQRSGELPSVPTMAESGLPDVLSLGWYGVLAPIGTPQPIIDRMTSALKEVLADPAVEQQLRTQLGAEPSYLPPQAFEDFYKADIAAWTAVVDASGIERQ
jgi:tripartite-type tricarboxylate transporter receptor subunit TctC